MNKYGALDSLNYLFGTYVDLELENFVLQKDLLAQPIIINDLKPLSKSHKFYHIIKNAYGLKDQQIAYLPSYNFQYTNPRSLNDIRKPKVFLFCDDLWEVKIYHPEEMSISSFFTGEYLFDTLKQGASGVIPKMIKERTGKSITHSDFKDISFKLELKLCTTYEKYIKTNRSKLNQSIDFQVSDAEILKKIHPTNMFNSIIIFHNDSKNSLFIERLKLWNLSFPGNIFQSSKTDLENFVQNLPISDFGIKDIGILNKIVQNFNQNISNEVLLTGEVGGNIFDRRHLQGFNKKLKNLLKK